MLVLCSAAEQSLLPMFTDMKVEALGGPEPTGQLRDLHPSPPQRPPAQLRRATRPAWGGTDAGSHVQGEQWPRAQGDPQVPMACCPPHGDIPGGDGRGDRDKGQSQGPGRADTFRRGMATAPASRSCPSRGWQGTPRPGGRGLGRRFCPGGRISVSALSCEISDRHGRRSALGTRGLGGARAVATEP